MWAILTSIISLFLCHVTLLHGIVPTADCPWKATDCFGMMIGPIFLFIYFFWVVKKFFLIWWPARFLFSVKRMNFLQDVIFHELTSLKLDLDQSLILPSKAFNFDFRIKLARPSVLISFHHSLMRLGNHGFSNHISWNRKGKEERWRWGESWGPTASCQSHHLKS